MLTLIALAAIAMAGYALACTVHPYHRCKRCAGLGERRTAILRTVVPCKACTATGWRLRAGRRLYNAARRIEGQVR